MVTVPVFGFGIRPLGPSTLPRRPTDFIMSGVAIRASKSVQLSFWIFSTISSPPKNSAPAASRFGDLSPRGDDRDNLGLAQAVGQNHRAADHLVGVLAGRRQDAWSDRRSRRTWRTWFSSGGEPRRAGCKGAAPRARAPSQYSCFLWPLFLVSHRADDPACRPWS